MSQKQIIKLDQQMQHKHIPDLLQPSAGDK